MEQFKKFKETIAQLEKAVKKVESATTQTQVNEADNEIGACLRSIQYGTGVVGIECKHLVESKNRELRGIKLTNPVKEVVEKVSKTIQRKTSTATKRNKKK